jgi:chloride channel protein, CIC family
MTNNGLNQALKLLLSPFVASGKKLTNTARYIMKKLSIRSKLDKFIQWRIQHVSDRHYILFLAVIAGLLGGIAAVVLKKSTRFITQILTSGHANQYENYLFILFPAIGILLVVLFMRYVIRQEVGHGIPGVLFSISRKNGIIKPHNTFSSIITSALTVGFGGSVGLEGPTVSTGAAIGSNIGQLLRLNFKQIILMISLASAGAMAAIFQSPIAAIVFAIEVIMIDLTMAALLPLLIATLTAVLTSYFMMGQAVMYPVALHEPFVLANTPYYLILAVLAGLISVYFTKVYITTEGLFRKIGSRWNRFIIGSSILGLLIFLFPALYGEGYEVVNRSLSGDYSDLFNNSIFYPYREISWVIFALFVALILVKALAASVTFGAGGVGGIFAPALFIGAFTGLFFAVFVNHYGLGDINPAKFAMVGMAGMIAGILHAPLTGIFLIAEITQGYELFVPLMMVSTISFATTKVFIKNSVYTHQLAQRGELLTHNKDRTVLNLMKVDILIENNFITVNPETTLGELVKTIATSRRNIFPVVDSANNFHGHILLDDIRNVMFDNQMYKTSVANLMVAPPYIIHPDETMEEVARKFQLSEKYNIPVVRDGKYIGYISRANVFSAYRNKLSEISDD